MRFENIQVKLAKWVMKFLFYILKTSQNLNLKIIFYLHKVKILLCEKNRFYSLRKSQSSITEFYQIELHKFPKPKAWIFQLYWFLFLHQVLYSTHIKQSNIGLMIFQKQYNLLIKNHDKNNNLKIEIYNITMARLMIFKLPLTDENYVISVLLLLVNDQTI